MSEVLSWIAYGLATLFFIACVVAWWEHLARTQRAASRADDDLGIFHSPAVQQPRVDVELDLDHADQAGDVADRRRALGQTLARLGEKPAGFGDTVPMILPGKTEAAPATATSAHEARRAETEGR